MALTSPLDADLLTSPVASDQFKSPVANLLAAVELPPVGAGTTKVLYGHFRLRRPSLTRRDAVAVAMQNRQEKT